MEKQNGTCEEIKVRKHKIMNWYATLAFVLQLLQFDLEITSLFEFSVPDSSHEQNYGNTPLILKIKLAIQDSWPCQKSHYSSHIV